MSADLFIRSLTKYRQAPSAILPTRKELAGQVFDNVRVMKPIVLGRLRTSACVTVGMDGWTNVRHEKVINLVPVANGVAYYWDSVVLKKRSTAAAQLPLISAGLESIIKAGVLVAGISSDNEMVNYTLFDLLIQPFPFLVHVPCAAHTIQLLVKSALLLPVVTDTLYGMDALLHSFDSNKMLRGTLDSLQATLRPGHVALRTIGYNATRWSSRLRSIQRILELKTCLIAMMPNIIDHLMRHKRLANRVFKYEESWWQIIAGLRDFLVPYQIATDIVQSDSSCLMDIYYQFRQLADEAKRLKPPHPLADTADAILHMIRMQWLGDGRALKPHVNVSAVIMCAVFWFNEDYTEHFDGEQVTAVNDWFFKWATESIVYYRLSKETERSRIRAVLFTQYSDFMGRVGAFQMTTELLDMANPPSAASASSSSRSTSTHSRWDPRAVWRYTGVTARELTACALALLSLTASEAAVERTFSKQGLVHTKLRNSLSSESVQAQMFLSFNHRAMSRTVATDEQGAWVDSAEDIETRPRARGLFLSSLPNDALLALPQEPAELVPAVEMDMGVDSIAEIEAAEQQADAKQQDEVDHVVAEQDEEDEDDEKDELEKQEDDSRPDRVKANQPKLPQQPPRGESVV